jgi:hypothetical protein
MHAEAYYFVKDCLDRLPPRQVVVEYGGRNVNGSVRELFNGVHSYTSVDIVPGDGVDRLADAVEYLPELVPDTVVCCEVLEHTAKWPEIVKAAGRILDPANGVLILTCACDPRAPHSTLDGGAVRVYEHYQNVDPMALTNILDQAGFEEHETSVLEDRGDLQVIAWRAQRA